MHCPELNPQEEIKAFPLNMVSNNGEFKLNLDYPSLFKYCLVQMKFNYWGILLLLQLSSLSLYITFNNNEPEVERDTIFHIDHIQSCPYTE